MTDTDQYRGLRAASRRRRRFTSTTKFCSKCERWQPHSAFRSDRGSASGLAALCKPCQVEALWANDMRKKYGITADIYYAMLAEQDGTPSTTITADENAQRSDVPT